MKCTVDWHWIGVAISVTLVASGALGCRGESASGLADRGEGTLDGPPSQWAGRRGLISDGVMGCPTIDPPPYNNESGVSSLSASFNEVCVACHGGQGRGQGTIPGIPGQLDYPSFVDVVRTGRRGMPAFDASEIDDATLEADYRALRGEGDSPVALEHFEAQPQDWNDSEIEEKMANGLAAWRKPDEKGAACANCHSPDAIDLAVIGYPNADIARRALLHIAPSDTRAIIDLIHAQRVRYGMTQVCDPLRFRPLQPGGEPLVGVDDVDIDAKFAQQLHDMELLVARGLVDSKEKAIEARDQWLLLNPRLLRTSVTLPRWTEDRFHGMEHSNINDWISSVPRRPAQNMNDAWYALHDAYLADPTDQNMLAIYDAVDEMTVADESVVDSPSRILFDGKYLSLLLTSHLFREELNEGKGWFERPPVIYGTDSGEEYGTPNPFWWIGNATLGASVPYCNGNFGGEVRNCMVFPDDALAELLPGQTTRDAWSALNHSWFMMGWVWDPGMVETSGKNINYLTGKYWSLPGYAESFFISNLRVALQVLGEDGGQLARRMGDGEVRPLLNGKYTTHAHTKFTLPDLDNNPQEELRQTLLVPIMANTFRMWAFLMRSALDDDARVQQKSELLEQVNEWRVFNQTYDDRSVDKELFDGLVQRIERAEEPG